MEFETLTVKEQNSNKMDNRLKTWSLEEGDFDKSLEGVLSLIEALLLLIKAWSFRQDELENIGEQRGWDEKCEGDEFLCPYVRGMKVEILVCMKRVWEVVPFQ